MRKILFLGFALLMSHGRAAADAHHELLGHQPIKNKRGKIVGFRAQVLVDPQQRTQNHSTLGGDIRLALGARKYDASKAVGSSSSDHHRDAVAGVEQGYVLHQFKMREITGPNPTDRGPHVETLQSGGAMKEVEVEVHYKDNPHLIPGTLVDLVAGFWKGSYWHVWGAAESPTHSSQDFVIRLPGSPSKKFLRKQIAALVPQLPKADAEAKAAQQQLDVASQTHTAAEQAHNAAYAAQEVPAQALRQSNQAAYQAHQAATQVPRDAYSAASRAARATYESAIAGPRATYDAAMQAAQTDFQNAGNTPQAQQVYNQVTQAAYATYNAAIHGPYAAYQKADADARAILTAATAASEAAYNQATQKNQAAYDAHPAVIAYTTAYQNYNTARNALYQAQTAKANAEKHFQDLTEKVSDFKQMLASKSAAKGAAAQAAASEQTP